MDLSVLFFSVGNSPPSHTDNLKINFLVLGERPTDDVNDSTIFGNWKSFKSGEKCFLFRFKSSFVLKIF